MPNNPEVLVVNPSTLLKTWGKFLVSSKRVEKEKVNLNFKISRKLSMNAYFH